MTRRTTWSLLALLATATLLLVRVSVSRPAPHADTAQAPDAERTRATPAPPAESERGTNAPPPATDRGDRPAAPRTPGEPAAPLNAPAPAPTSTEAPPEPQPQAAPSPSSAAARVTPEQALREVRALVDQGTIGAARALAERYLRELPDGPEARQIMSLTGVHPHP